MRCRDVATMASDYIEGEVPWRRRLVLRLHLMMCQACQEYVHQLRQVVALLASTRSLASSDDRTARSLFRVSRASQ